MSGCSGKRKAMSVDKDATGPSTATQRQGEKWCVECWSGAESGCRGAAHHLVDKLTAEMETQAALASATTELERQQWRLVVKLAGKLEAHEATVIASSSQVSLERQRQRQRHLDLVVKLAVEEEEWASLASAARVQAQRQKRLEEVVEEVVEKAVDQTAPVLLAVLDGNDGRGGVTIERCDLRFALATAGLSDDDKAFLVEALDNTDVVFPTPARGVGADGGVFMLFEINCGFRKSLHAKFPDREPGKTYPRNTVALVLRKNFTHHLAVFTEGMLPHQGEGTKIFGQLTASPDSLHASCCDGDCGGKRLQCICTGEGNATSTISAVGFEP